MPYLRLLGPVRVEQRNSISSKGKVVAADSIPHFRSRRTVGLLGYLVAEQRAFARDHLASLFWPDSAPASGRANLSRELHNLGQILPHNWQADRQAVAFVLADGTAVDLYQVRQLQAQERWDQAAELLGGEFLEGLYLQDNPEFENWLLLERERWRQCAEVILRHVVKGQARRGRYTDALHQAQRLLQLAPWDEETHRDIMRLLAWTGRRGAALRQYEKCRRIIGQELDLDPSPQTITLHRQIQEGKLDVPPQLPAFLAGERARNKYERASFFGRAKELERMRILLETALAGEGQVLFVTGEPGRGKTALLEAFAQHAMELHYDLLVAHGKCNAYSGMGDPFLPFRELLAMLTGDVEGRWDAGAISGEHARRLWRAFPLAVSVLLDHGPHLLDALVPGPALLSRAVAVGQGEAPWLSRLRQHLSPQWSDAKELGLSSLFQEAVNVLQTLSWEQPLLLILDDIQWADAASTSLLFHLGQSLLGINSRLLIACAYRPEEVALNRSGQRHPLAKVLSEFKRNWGDVWVHLDQTTAEEDRRFVDVFLDDKPNRLDEQFRSALFRRTGGHPLFTVEMLRALIERGDLQRDADGAWTAVPTLDWHLLPARVEAVIAERIDRLDPLLQDILTIASVEGETFTTQVVAKVQGMSTKSTLRLLSQDLMRQHRLLREQEEVDTAYSRLSRYQFSHILFQDYLYQRLSAVERRLLHGDVAAAIEELYSDQLDKMAVQLAQHFEQARNISRAFFYYGLAAERAARLYENEEAINHYTRAIELAGSFPADIISLAQLYRGRGLACERVGEFSQANIDHQTILQVARDAGEQQTAWRALLDLGRLWTSRDYRQAQEYFAAALALARRLGEPASVADSLNWMGNWHANDENPLQAVTYHQEALEIFQKLGNQREMANTLDLLALANILAGNLAASVPYYNQAILLFRHLGNRSRLVSSLTGRATTVAALAWLGSIPANPLPEAMLDFAEALELAGQIGSAPVKAWAHYSQGMLHMVRGQFGSAQEDGQNSLRIASGIQHREYEVGARYTLGLLYSQLFAADQARQQLQRALTLARELRSPTWINNVTGALVEAYLLLEDHRQAHNHLKTIISPQTPMDTLGKRYCWIWRAELALKQHDSALALDITKRLIASTPAIAAGGVVTYLWKLKAQALATEGQLAEACALLQAAVANAQQADERFLLWRLHALLGRYYYTLGKQQESKKELAAAQTAIAELAHTIPDESLRYQFRQGALCKLEALSQH